jgi:hypothetical protein
MLMYIVHKHLHRGLTKRCTTGLISMVRGSGIRRDYILDDSNGPFLRADAPLLVLLSPALHCSPIILLCPMSTKLADCVPHWHALSISGQASGLRVAKSAR